MSVRLSSLTTWKVRLDVGQAFQPDNLASQAFQPDNLESQAGKPDRHQIAVTLFVYDDELRQGGHFLGGEALQAAQNAATLRYRNGQVLVTDGPYAETKEQLGGLLFLEARDLNHAIQRMAKHPGVRAGAFEIRAADEKINAAIAARKT